MYVLSIKDINGHRLSGKRRSDSFYFFWTEQSELLVCLQCWQFRLPWQTCVRVQISNKFWLSINRKNSIIELKISNVTVVRAPVSGIMGREFESRTIRFPSNQSIWFSFSLSFLFIFLNFEILAYFACRTARQCNCEWNHVKYTKLIPFYWITLTLRVKVNP